MCGMQLLTEEDYWPEAVSGLRIHVQLNTYILRNYKTMCEMTLYSHHNHGCLKILKMLAIIWHSCPIRDDHTIKKHPTQPSGKSLYWCFLYFDPIHRQ